MNIKAGFKEIRSQVLGFNHLVQEKGSIVLSLLDLC
jgi:hypothetical protein